MGILLVALTSTGCGAFQPAPDGQVPSGQVAGNAFQFTAYQVAGGVCVELTYGNSGGGSCGDLPAVGSGFGMVGSGNEADIPDEVWGVVSEHASSVAIETEAGPPAQAFLLSLDPIGLHDQLFFAFLPVGSTPRAVVASGEDGSLIERLEFVGGHRAPGNAPVPTPAGDTNSP
jgi:hypothetical protein